MNKFVDFDIFFVSFYYKTKLRYLRDYIITRRENLKYNNNERFCIKIIFLENFINIRQNVFFNIAKIIVINIIINIFSILVYNKV